MRKLSSVPLRIQLTFFLGILLSLAGCIGGESGPMSSDEGMTSVAIIENQPDFANTAQNQIKKLTDAGIAVFDTRCYHYQPDFPPGSVGLIPTHAALYVHKIRSSDVSLAETFGFKADFSTTDYRTYNLTGSACVALPPDGQFVPITDL